MWTATIGHDFFFTVEVAQLLLETCQWDVDGAGQVSGRILLLGTHVDHGDQPLTGTLEQLPGRHRFEVILDRQVTTDKLFHLCQMAFRDIAQLVHQRHDIFVAEAVVDRHAFLACRDQSRLTQLLQVLRGIGDRQSGNPGQRIHAALALGEEFEQLEPVGAGERLADARKLGEQRLFEACLRCCLGHVAASSSASCQLTN